ncbi:Nucleolar protein 56 [Nosema granulosis]|uniref:Nucleolar protein 56 n=1 Tax=Nosema granulosis TaxID=83296 RepID=A0A9P6KZS7_9MICR|nr:Nucleolar protein 56 [Nosema granulosis]
MEHLLFEHPQGYLLFELKEYEDISKESFSEYLKLLEAIKLVGRLDFQDLDMATQNIAVLCNNKLPLELSNFLELNNVKTLFCDGSLKSALNEIGIEQKNCVNITRGIRHNLRKFLKNEESERKQFLLSTSHAFSRNKVEFSSRNEDSVLFHTVNMLDQVEKDINSYTMRIKEIYGWSFPELFGSCKNNDEFIYIVNFFLTGKMHKNINESRLETFKTLKTSSIGVNISKEDVENMINLCDIIEKKMEIRANLKEYLYDKIEIVAPNLAVYLGEYIAAKLIVLAGGILNLAKAPASTIQLLGAEKSLFKALKERSDTPKYGVLYHSSFVVKTNAKDKARISRFIASKISILAKIDYFSSNRTKDYGTEIKKLTEKKINSLTSKQTIENTDEILSRVYKKINNI